MLNILNRSQLGSLYKLTDRPARPEHRDDGIADSVHVGAESVAVLVLVVTRCTRPVVGTFRIIAAVNYNTNVNTIPSHTHCHISRPSSPVTYY